MYKRLLYLLIFFQLYIFNFEIKPICAGDLVNLKVVEVNLGGATFMHKLPYDEEFLLKGNIGTSNCDTIFLSIDAGQTLKWTRLHKDETIFLLRCPALDYNKPYDFSFKLIEKSPGTSQTPPIKITGQKPYAKAMDWINFEAGTGYADNPRYGFIYTVIHFYLRPINQDVYLPLFRFNEFRERFSIFAGLAIGKMYSGKEVTDLFDRGNPLLGAGWRLTRIFKLNCGFVWFKQSNSNPLITEKETKESVFVGASFDFDFGTLIKPFSGIFGL